MKKITLLSIAFLIAGVLTACGGAGSTDVADGGGDPTTPSNPNPSSPTTDSAGLIIDNGRGTVNNQDTENPK